MRLSYEYDISASFTWNLTTQDNKLLHIWHQLRQTGRRCKGRWGEETAWWHIIFLQYRDNERLVYLSPLWWHVWIHLSGSFNSNHLNHQQEKQQSHTKPGRERICLPFYPHQIKLAKIWNHLLLTWSIKASSACSGGCSPPGGAHVADLPHHPVPDSFNWRCRGVNLGTSKHMKWPYKLNLFLHVRKRAVCFCFFICFIS